MSDLPPVYGLVLAGGRSRRFGSDKAAFRPAPGAEPLVLRAVRQVREAGITRTCVSVRPGQRLAVELPPDLETIEDRYDGIGPLAGLLAGWQRYPEAAWLVVACDLAALDAATLRILVAGRSHLHAATAFAHPDDGRPEPLCAIYEPSARRTLEAVVSEGRSSLRRYLSTVLPESALLVPPRPHALANFNHPESFPAEDASPSR